MSKITSEVTNTVTIENTAGLTETFIFNAHSRSLDALHTAALLSIALSAIDKKIEVFTTAEFELGLIFCEYEVGIRNGEIIIKDAKEEFVLSLSDVGDHILLPFNLVMPDLVPLITEHEYDHGDIHCWLLEDLTGYFSGGDSDIWILTNDGKLIVTEEIHDRDRSTSELKASIVFDIAKQWSEEEIKNSDLIKGIVKASY